MYYSLLSGFLPVITSIVKFKSLQKELKVLFFYITIAFIANVLSTWLIRYTKVNLLMYHLVILIEYICVMYIIASWQVSLNVKRIFKYIFFAYIIFWLVAKTTFEPISGGYSFSVAISQTILALSAGYTLFIVLGNSSQPLLSNQRFWILLSFVIFFLGTLMPYALTAVIFKVPSESMYVLWYINWILIIISNILYTVGVLCPQTRR